VCLVLASLLPAALSAGERDLEFVRGLREKRYFDYALLYLDQLENRPLLDRDVKVVLPYERAITHLEQSRTLRNAEARSKELDLAEASLEQFVKSAPDHPLAAQASTERAQILLGRGRVEVWQARSADNGSRRAEFQQRARELFGKARQLFQAAHDRHKAEWDKLPRTPIDPDQKELRAAREKVEAGYLRAQLDLAICTYEESQTHDATAGEFRGLLSKAAREFESIHEKYRSQVVGLHARMWQGKCFEEQGEIGKALGIYNELLQHPGRSDAMQQLQDRVRQFRLICLNHEKNKDYQLVVQEASAWLVQSKDRASTPVGLGIRWERARAYEQLAGKQDLPENVRAQNLKNALEDAREINRFAGEFKDPSTAMTARLNVALNRDPGDPKQFEAALGMARKNVNEIARFNERLAAAKGTDQEEQIKNERRQHLRETARLLKLALELAQSNTDPRELQNARYYLAFAQYELGNGYEAGILGEYVARRLKVLDPPLALEAAFLSFAAWQQSYFAASEGRRDTELRMLTRAAENLAAGWPDSERAAEALITVGQIHDRMKQPLTAARYYEQVGETSDQFGTARLSAGQSYWTAWLNVASLPDDQKPSDQDRNAWRDTAEKLLRQGIDRTREDMISGEPVPGALIAARVSLAQISVSQGDYDKAIEFLTAKPNAPIEAIQVADEASRPAEGIQGRPFAGLVYQLLLRSYVGSQRIDEALNAMKGLEGVAGGAGGEGIAAVYVSLGREIQKEIERLVELKDEARLQQVRDSFEQFLQKLAELSETQNLSYGSLIWIAETYYSLGQGMKDDRRAASAYFEKASKAYERILDRDKAEPDFVADDREPGVMLRLVNCRKREGRYEDALEQVQLVLRKLPLALDAQFEAASVLQEWGADDPEKYLAAINGLSNAGSADKSSEGAVWGWAQIATRLQRILASGSSNDSYRDRFAEARYNIAQCRRGYGLSRKMSAERSEVLSMALQEIDAFVLIAGPISDEWWQQLDSIYRQIQKDIGRTAKPLQKPEVHVAESPAAETPAAKSSEPAPVAPAANGQSKAANGRAAAPQKPPSGTGSPALWGLIAVMLAAGAAAGFFVWSSRSTKRRRAAGAFPEQLTGQMPSPRAGGAKRSPTARVQPRGIDRP